MPKVSVIVPVYNVEKYLKRCLDSLINQTYMDYEIICINDCSPDRSQKILDMFLEKYPSVIRALKNLENVGQGKSRDRGISVAAGKYILFVDSDDYVKKNYIETYVCAMEKENCDIVIGGFIKDYKGKQKIHNVPDSIWSNTTYGITCAKMFRKDFILKHGLSFTGIRSSEDVYFNLCAFYAGATYHVLDYAGYYYYYNPKSTTSSINYEKKQEVIVSTVFDNFLSGHDIAKISKKRQKVIEYTYIANMVNALITFGHGAGIKGMKEKYQYVLRDLNEKFPNYKSNPYIGIFKPKGQMMKIRLGVGITMRLHKMHLDRWMFYLISLL